MAEKKKHSIWFWLIILGVLAALGVLFVAVLIVVAPWNMPAIFKRNYPDWFAAHPLLDRLISVN